MAANMELAKRNSVHWSTPAKSRVTNAYNLFFVGYHVLPILNAVTLIDEPWLGPEQQ